MTKLEKIEREVEQAVNSVEYAERLIKVLVDPSAWEYTGECYDAGPGATSKLNPPRCVCGHPIRYVFRIRAKRDIGNWRAGDIAQVGCVCVNTIDAINPALVARIRDDARRLEEEYADAVKRARAAQQQEEIARLESEWRELRDRAIATYESYRERGQFAPRPLWEAVASRKYSLPYECPRYTRAADFRRWYSRQIELWKHALGE